MTRATVPINGFIEENRRGGTIIRKVGTYYITHILCYRDESSSVTDVTETDVTCYIHCCTTNHN